MALPPQSFDELVERIGAGQTIDPDSLPEALRALPEVQRLLAFARVAQGLSQATPPAAENQQLGPWVCVRALGSGGMGDVWLGERRDGVVTQQVAIKRLRVDTERFRARLRAERQILARLEHPGIARFIDAGVDERGAPWMAIEYVSGVTLTQWARGRSLRERLTLFQRICAAVAYAHRHLIVHRDLKPANVLVNNEGEPKLLDFGIAKLLDDTQRESTLASMTPAYAAPEQLRGEPISTATDVYALGLMLFELLAGRLPDSRTGSAMALAVSVDAEETQRVSQAASTELPYLGQTLSGDLDAIVAGALRAEPQRRYPSATALSEDIDRFLRNEPVQARRPTRRYLFAKFLSRNRYAAAFALVAALALVAGSALALQEARRADRQAQIARDEAARAIAQSERALKVKDFVIQIFGESDGINRTGEKARSPLDMVQAGIEGAERDLADDDELRDAIIGDLVDLEIRLGRNDPELKRINAVVAFREQRYGNDARLADALITRVLAQFQLGRFVESEADIARARAIYAQVEGDHDLKVASLDAQLARVRFAQTQYADAVALMRQVVASFERIRGPNHADTALRLSNLAGFLSRMNQYDEARDISERALAILEKARGENHAILLFPLQNLGDIERNTFHYDKALVHYQRMRDILRKEVGENHPRYAMSLQRIGSVHRQLGQLDEARAITDAARIIQAQGGYAELGESLFTLGMLAMDRDRPEEALDWFTQAQRFTEQRQGPQHIQTWLRLGAMANALAASGRHAEARKARERTIAGLSALGPSARIELAFQDINAGLAERLAGDADRAIELLSKGNEELDSLLPAGNPIRMAAAIQLMSTLARRGDPGDAERVDRLMAALPSPVANLSPLAQAHWHFARAMRSEDPERAVALGMAREQAAKSGADGRWLRAELAADRRQ